MRKKAIIGLVPLWDEKKERILECGGDCAVRDSMEKNLFELFLTWDKAVLGICRRNCYCNSSACKLWI